jgi:hypothetical protein
MATARSRFRIIAIILTALAAVGLCALSVWWLAPPLKHHPYAGKYAGKTRAEIIEALGEPTEEWEGHYGNPPVSYVRQYSPAKTCVFARSDGSLYVSFHQVNGDWICFSSTWLPKGAAF